MAKQPLAAWEALILQLLCCYCFSDHPEERHHHLYRDESKSSGSPGEPSFLISRPIMYLEILKHEGSYSKEVLRFSHTTGVSILLKTEQPLCLCLCPVETPSPAPLPQIPSAHQALLTEQTLPRANVPVFVMTALYPS